MTAIYDYVWIVLIIIIFAALIKVLYLAVQEDDSNHQNNNRSQNSGHTNNRSNVNPSRTVSNHITETGPITYYANDRHNQYDKEYRFNYKYVSGSWRAYILRMPSLGNRDSSGAATHRHFDNGHPYICWDSPVTTLKGMQDISRVWADSIQEYIATGQRFG